MDLRGLTVGGASGPIIVLVAERVKEVYSTERGLVPTHRMYSKYFSASFLLLLLLHVFLIIKTIFFADIKTVRCFRQKSSRSLVFPTYPL